MTDWVRVKDNDTGAEYSWPRDAVNEAAVTIIDDKAATTPAGDPLPAKINRPLSSLRTDDGQPLETLTKPQLLDYADAHSIDLGDATLKDDVLTAVADAEAARADLA